MTPGQDTGKRTGSRLWLPASTAADPPVSTAQQIMVRRLRATTGCDTVNQSTNQSIMQSISHSVNQSINTTLRLSIALTRCISLTKSHWCMLMDHSRKGDFTKDNSVVDVAKKL